MFSIVCRGSVIFCVVKPWPAICMPLPNESTGARMFKPSRICTGIISPT